MSTTANPPGKAAMPSAMRFDEKDALRVSFVTMGCAKNEVDSLRMRDALESAGFLVTEDPGLADAVIVNTCSFIQDATEESIDAVLDMLDLASVRAGDAKVIVAGCMPARYRADLAEEFAEVAAFVACEDEGDIVRVVADALDIDVVPYRPDLKDEAGAPPSAYVKISDGCDRFCSYCTIPFIRGAYRSFAPEEIEAEVEGLVARGTKEIVFIGQDTGRWGSDFEWPSSLAVLLTRCAEKHPDTWFRVMYLQPEGLSESLLDVMAKHGNVCSYLDIPLQHVDGGILAEMNRSGSRDEFTKLIDRIRRRLPEVTLRTTLIAGFPGESEEAFEELCEFVEEAEFDYVGVFAYSREDGTRAAELPGQIDEETKLERAQRLRDIADAISAVRVARRVGTRMDVLVLGEEEDGQLYGRAQCQAPEVDGVTYLPSGDIGAFRPTTIVDSLFYEMEGV